MLINGISDIHYIRNIGDVDLIINKFLSKREILILGGGFIGLEVASIARKLGINIYQYLTDRIKGSFEMTSLDQLIMEID